MNLYTNSYLFYNQNMQSISYVSGTYRKTRTNGELFALIHIPRIRVMMAIIDVLIVFFSFS